MAGLAERLAGLRAAIAEACARAGRDPGGVRLLAVSKLQPAAAVAEALAAGQLEFGENYAQELRDKDAELRAKDAELRGLAIAPAALAGLRWHFIGHLQRNKLHLVAGRVALIHSIDSVELIEALKARLERGPDKSGQDILIEVSLAGEQQKAGCPPAEVPALLDAIAACGGLVRCRGLMGMPPLSDEAEASRPYFRRLRELRDELARTPRPHVSLDELSMGMSHDFAVAIAEGATLVRIGTALFGPRPAR
ncbi:MAG: YggS family pyridoxal phosphate-dependent enzyme [Polyangia bacterium]